ncbi:MAG TPA: N-acyl homoserine lactonase family protein, partial [Acidimicrobiales bacterium]|nr:N-acyl homoserine lactonase family protein [Acidimicrobiales bacterium]
RRRLRARRVVVGRSAGRVGVRATGVRRVILLTLGWAELPKSWSVHGAPADLRLREPVPAVLVQVDGGWVLLDTGYNTALIRDPELRRRYHDGFQGIVPILPAGEDPLLEALEAAGVRVGAITEVAVSHLHNDHAGGLHHFARRVPVHLQRDELAFGLGEHAEQHGIFRVDFDDPAIDWQLADGDVDVAPGITAIKTAGHTPGHQSFVVRYDDSLGGGGFVFAFDAADLAENIQHEAPIGGVVGCEPADTVEHIRRLKALAASEKLRLVPGHDPDVWPRLTKDLAAVGGVPQDA